MTAGRQRQWLRSALATTQMALALALLFASALAIDGRGSRPSMARWASTSRTCSSVSSMLPERTYADAEKRRRFVTMA